MSCPGLAITDDVIVDLEIEEPCRALLLPVLPPDDKTMF